MVSNLIYHFETDEEELEKIKQHIETEEERKEKKKLLREVESPVEFRGLVFKNWIEKKSGSVFNKKQHKLKRIGQPRHLSFDKLFHERFIKEKWFEKKINYKVFDISYADVDAIVFNIEKYVPLEVYELTNYSKHRFGIASTNATKKLQKSGKSPYSIPISDISNEWKEVFQKEKERYYTNPHSTVSTKNVRRHVENLTKFNCKRYVVFSHPESLTDHALWEYAKNGIHIKILRHQD